GCNVCGGRATNRSRRASNARLESLQLEPALGSPLLGGATMSDVTARRRSIRSKTRVGRYARLVAAALTAVSISLFAAGVANAATATHFSVSAPASAIVGNTATVTVTALDSGNAIVTTIRVGDRKSTRLNSSH